MAAADRNSIYRLTVWVLLVFSALVLRADDGILNRKVELKKNKGTIYQLLKQVSDQSGYLFIYDSNIINNDAEVKIKKGEYSIRQAIYTITGNSDLKISVLGKHILLNAPDKKPVIAYSPVAEPIEDTTQFISLSGILYDHFSDEPISFAAIGINNSTIGTISNQNGEFKLIIPDSLSRSIVRFSHVGYQNHEIEASILSGQDIRLSLEPKVFPLQEIVVRVVNPKDVLTEMMKSRDVNYSRESVYMTTFYREGIEYKKKNIELTEGVLKLYKTGYQHDPKTDQVKLLKMRRVIKPQAKDTIFPKMKSGINSCLILDVIKDTPEFLNAEEENYVFRHTDITVIDDRRVNVISFEQKDFIHSPLYKGELFIDAENNALVRAHFKMNPTYIEQATSWFIAKKSKDIKLSLRRAEYIASYKQSADGKYYINHVRGDIEFRARRKSELFNSPLHFWFEMVNCKIDVDNVKAFSRKERLSPHNIFSETKYKYDKNFWGSFNIILPEDKLREMIINNLNEVVEIP